MDISPTDRDLMIRTVYGEAGNQPDEGQSAVASVILNRARAGRFGGTTPGAVVLAPHQFEPWQTRASELQGLDPKSPAYQRAASAVDSVIAGAPDPTNGATHFLQEDIVRKRRGGTLPDWASGNSVKIGAHTFYGMPMAKAQTAMPDLLDSFSAPAPAASSAAPAAPSAPAGGDLLDMFGAPAPAAATSTTAPTPPGSTRITIRPKDATPSDLPRRDLELADTLARHQSDSFPDTMARLGIGAVRGVGDVADTLAQGIGYVGEHGANKLQDYGVISPESAKAVQDWRGRINNQITEGNAAFDAAQPDAKGLTATDIGRLGGNVVASGPLLEAGGVAMVPSAVRGALAIRAAAPGANALTRIGTGAANVGRSVVSGAGTGAGAAALTSSASDQPLDEQIASGLKIGAALGPVGLGVSRAGSRLFGGHLDRETAALARTAQNFGVDVGAGQISANPMTRFLDSVLQRLPFSGYGARSGEQQAAFNRAISNTFGEDATKITHQTMQAARTRLGNAFDDIANRTGAIQVDAPFLNRLQGILGDARQVLPASEAGAIENQLRAVVSKIDGQTRTISPETYQALTRKGAPLDRAIASRDPNIRYYAGAVREALDDVMQRSAPADVVHDLVTARSQWKALKTVEPLAKKATTGDISPNNLINQVAKGYSGAGGQLGELGRVGRRFLTEPPSSGTAERSLLLQHLIPGAVGLTGLGGLAASYHFDPDSWERNALLAGGTLAAGRTASSALRSRMIANLMINRSLGTFAQPSNRLLQVLPSAGAIESNRPSAPAVP